MPSDQLQGFEQGNTEKCLVINYRALNKVTQKFMWPMPRVKGIFSKLSGD